MLADLICKNCDEAYTDFAAFVAHTVCCAQPSSQIFICSVCSLLTNKKFVNENHCQAVHNGKGSMRPHMRLGSDSEPQPPVATPPVAMPPSAPVAQTPTSSKPVPMAPPAAVLGSASGANCKRRRTSYQQPVEPSPRRIKSEFREIVDVKPDPAAAPTSTGREELVQQAPEAKAKVAPAIIAPSAAVRRGRGRGASARIAEATMSAALRPGARRASQAATSRIRSSLIGEEDADDDFNAGSGSDKDDSKDNVNAESAESDAASLLDSQVSDSSRGTSPCPASPSVPNSTSTPLCEPLAVARILLGGVSLPSASAVGVTVQFFSNCATFNAGPDRCLMVSYRHPDCIIYANNGCFLLRLCVDDYLRARDLLGFEAPVQTEVEHCRLCLRLERPLTPFQLSCLSYAVRKCRRSGRMKSFFAVRKLLVLSPEWADRLLAELNGEQPV